ncbi:glycosyltransferase [Halomicroarcula sp. GCM10025709]|uniref:glycosyltransferase n=1 Tax=Halomicroarcula sp. GCM10025709 TaxID=3252669 RepID=UPI0036166423
MCDEGLKVLHVITGINVGGAENHLLSLCRGLTSRGIDVSVAYLRADDDELTSKFREAGCSVISVNMRHDADPAALARLVKHARGAVYDIVHGHLFHGTVYGSVAAVACGSEFIVSKHNDHPFWADQPVKTVHELALKPVDRVICLSDYVREYLLETTQVDPGLVETVHYGLDPTRFDEVSASARRQIHREFDTEEGFLVGTIGRLTEQKNLGILLRSFQEVVGEHPTAKLAVVGRGEEEEQLKALATKLGIDDHIIFTGFREDIPELMHAFDVFVLPSRWEGFGVVFLEAMAARTPVVASDTSAIPEVIGTGEGTAGVLADSDDTGAFADTINRLLSDAEYRAELGDSGRERLESRFSVPQMVEQIATIYSACTGKQRPSRAGP